MIDLYTINDFQERKDIVRLIVDMEQVNSDGSFYVYHIGNNSSVPTITGQPFYIHEELKHSVGQLKIVPAGFKFGLEVKDGEVLELYKVPEEVLLIRQKEAEIQELQKILEQNQ